jgi:hypothetical protein
VKVLEQEKKAKRRRVSDLGKFATITEVSTMYTYNNQIVSYGVWGGRRIRTQESGHIGSVGKGRERHPEV